ncbi:Undecaprenyl-phosphate glucose phosphotransferase [Rhodoblastus acidophilus]|uniref:undecaprenyl-phosphate glucose phosphotransferase n=1 Tax=Rhodoblastus acidophilus TaxID=1074 RepID=UPI0022243FBA|nr:undecaprenyl-phosphate glucose phosphotransferase [Rhodoblastus acidophilus]MCW2284132.1 Undecaprenyl-phosphate glucose phosphotransferase [Rhodoblastus acidophilus]MCW2332828.1 Undecaprenyl-phosphate glucose phosphotransferase [Rhodoblastus acidophilus]
MKHVTPAEIRVPAARRPRLSAAVLGAGLGAVEAGGLTALALALAPNAGLARDAGLAPAQICGVAALVLIFLASLRASGAYRLEALRAPPAALLGVAALWCAVVLAAMALAMSLQAENHLPFLWRWLGFGLILLTATRALAGAWTRRMAERGLFDRYAAIVGGGPMAELLLETLSRQPEPNLRILGVFDDRGDERSPDVIAGYPKLGTVDELVAFARHVRLDQLIVALPVSAEGRILGMLRKLWVLPVDIRLAAHANRLRFRPRAYTFIGAVPTLALLDKPLSDGALFAKAVFDKLVGGLLLLASAPLMALIALAVRLTSPGPAIFKQERLGFNNERIVVYKFRTLYHDQCDPRARQRVRRDDPRVTPLGRVLRRSSLDELPQFFNVIKGDLSLVGPRPHAPDARAADRDYHAAVDGYFARHRVKPGVTGWAQVNGWRGETDTLEKLRKRVDHDLDYIENWSMLLDLYIVARTPFALLFGPNAY